MEEEAADMETIAVVVVEEEVVGNFFPLKLTLGPPLLYSFYSALSFVIHFPDLREGIYFLALKWAY